MVLDLSSNPKVNYLDCNPQQELETELAPQWDDEMNAYTLNLKALLGENTDFSRITLLDDIELDPDTGIARFIAIPASLTYRYALYPENENLVLEVKILLPHTHSLFQVRERAADCLTAAASRIIGSAVTAVTASRTARVRSASPGRPSTSPPRDMPSR